MVGNVDAQRELEALRREGQIRAVSHQRHGIGLPLPGEQDGARVDVQAHRAEAQTPRELSAGAAQVEDESRADLRKDGLQLFHDEASSGGVLNELVYPGFRDEKRGGTLEQRFRHGFRDPDCRVRTASASPDSRRRKIDPRGSDTTGR